MYTGPVFKDLRIGLCATESVGASESALRDGLTRCFSLFMGFFDKNIEYHCLIV